MVHAIKHKDSRSEYSRGCFSTINNLDTLADSVFLMQIGLTACYSRSSTQAHLTGVKDKYDTRTSLNMLWVTR
jgi:hypothetical protein